MRTLCNPLHLLRALMMHSARYSFREQLSTAHKYMEEPKPAQSSPSADSSTSTFFLLAGPFDLLASLRLVPSLFFPSFCERRGQSTVELEK